MVLSISQAKLKALATHFIGNRAVGEELQLSRELISLDQFEVCELLQRYFITPFVQAETYHLSHPSDLSLNEVKHYADKIFEIPEELLLHSISLARHLFEVTDMPNIKSGELHVGYFENLQADQLMVSGICICKSENKQSFLKIDEVANGYQFEALQGIDPSNMDKACLILNMDQETGYRVMVVDKTNKSNDAQFWKDKFLKVRAASDDFHHTQDYLNMYKSYVVEQIPSEFEVTKVEQIDLLNKSVSYFKKNEQFSRQQFEEEVLQIPEVIQSFRKYEDQYTSERDLSFNNEFGISDHAVKKQSRVFKSVLKLDKNFHVYIHGNKELIEKGYDASMGMHYYKIYFEEEN